MNKGDIVLIPFPFSDLKGNKNWPAIVLIDSVNDVTICFITTQLKWQSDFDIIVQPTKLNNLKKTSLLRLSKIVTVDKELIIGLLGQLDDKYIGQLDDKLIKILKLKP